MKIKTEETLRKKDLDKFYQTLVDQINAELANVKKKVEEDLTCQSFIFLFTDREAESCGGAGEAEETAERDGGAAEEEGGRGGGGEAAGGGAEAEGGDGGKEEGGGGEETTTGGL